MARTPLMVALQRAAAQAARDEGDGSTRRDVLVGAGALAAAGSLASATRWLPAANAATAPRIVVVGAGLAGLTAAYRLKQAGHDAQVFEAADRVGGRCWTIRGAFDGGQIAEHGGELIDQGHGAIRRLAQSLGLKLDNLLSAEQNGTEAGFWFDGALYSEAEATDDLKAIWQQIHADVSAASYPTLYNVSTERGRELDATPLDRYIDSLQDATPRLKQLLDVAYNIEYGAETSDQSTLNMLYLLAYSGQGQLRIFGPSNEKYHVAGGNDQIPARMADALAGQIRLGHELTAISRNADGTYTLGFRGGSVRSATADKVVLALPFSILRSSVDISGAQFEPRKRRAIALQGMGTNSKLNVQFSDRHWRALGFNGDTYADTGYQATWEVTRAQPGTPGILVDYTGGLIGASFGSGAPRSRAPRSRAQQFCAQIEPLLPGITEKFNGRATIDFWPAYPWTKGSYSYWKPGQYQDFAGAEGERSFDCHFCGEHTSIDFQGYLNGAVETGERAAGEILDDLK